jgi:hypothetical protein
MKPGLKVLHKGTICSIIYVYDNGYLEIQKGVSTKLVHEVKLKIIEEI